MANHQGTESSTQDFRTEKQVRFCVWWKGTPVRRSVGRRTRGRPERARDDRDQPMACRLLFPLRPPRPFLCVATITQSDGRRTDELPIWGRVWHSYVVFLVKFEGQFVYTIIL